MGFTSAEMGFAQFLLILPLLSFLTTTSNAQSGFKCSLPASCSALVGYAPFNATTLSEIQSQFNVTNLSSILGANNLPLSTPGTHMIKSKQTVRVPIPCNCSNSTGVSNKVPIYKVKKDDGLYLIANTVFSGLLDYHQIVIANKIPNENEIDIGQELWIPLPCSCDEVDGEKVVHYAHVVAANSTVEQIAQQFGTNSQTLLSLNGMTNDNQLKADQSIDVPLKACNSSIRNDSLDYPLLVANGSYAITANACVKCNCNSANNWTLQCEPSQLSTNMSTWGTCPSMQCEEGSGNLVIGNTTSSNCNGLTCAYAGYNNQSILTSLESTCPAPPGNNSSKIESNWNFLFISVFSLLLCFYLS